MNSAILKRDAWSESLKRLLRNAGYRKHTIITYSNRGSVTMRQPYWSGGSRDAYYVLNATTGRLTPIGVSNPTPWPQPPAEEEFVLTHGAIFVQGGTFCGKPATWILTALPSTWEQLGQEVTARC